LAAALNMLQESRSASRIIILLTDGEQNADSIAPLDATSLASALNIRVYTIGVGPEAQPGRFGGIDVPLLLEIADRTGAQYFNPESAEDLADVYAEISSLETSRIGRERFADYDELGPLLLGIAAALVLADLLLRATWLRRLPA
ncbi:MAG: VWA domain-containing protein, partial [Dehalococcoidia bacterium]